ncbi:hypothetical protein L3Q82_002280 [Scortum barcoo]|uniref:Uncharacterized protein n=1 Tax=Scortum barcoo TaxID=214431 RepID=A0ACB8VY50_9TELE|nr:hypothetical protein L3Q82_002280 [Scortum barcoo]
MRRGAGEQRRGVGELGRGNGRRSERRSGTVQAASSIVYKSRQAVCRCGERAAARRRSTPTASTPNQPRTAPPPADSMPCRKENYIFLEQSVTVGSKEVDALVTKIGEALQLHNNGGGQKTVSVSVSCLHGLTGGGTGGGKATTGGGAGGGGGAAAAAPAQRRAGCCMRLRSTGHRGHRGGSRASPYSIPGSNGEQDWDQIRPWNKKRISVEEDDPHRLLQELILSGNLIKEAVRRLQFSAADCGDFPDNVASPTTSDTVALTSHLMKALERIVLRHLRPLVSPNMDPLQFAYQPGIGVDDAVIYLLQRSLSHLEDAGNTVRITFFDFSSAFNTIHPSLTAQGEAGESGGAS